MNIITYTFPLLGKDDNWAVSKQPLMTSPSLSNVRPYDVQDNRARGGQRPGLQKIMTYDGTPSDNAPIIAIEQLTVVTYE